MKKAKLILCMGAFVAVLPYLGFPYAIKNILISFSGLGLAYVGFMLYKHHSIVEGESGENFDNFSENKDFVEEATGETEIIVNENTEENNS